MHFNVFIPSIATQCNTLKQMLLEDADMRTSGPIALMQYCPSESDVKEISSSPMKTFSHLAKLDTFSQNKFKNMIRTTLKENTVTPKQNEKLVQYLRRHCHRDESRISSARFTSEFECTIERNKKKKKKGKVDAEREAQLEALKWDMTEKSTGATSLDDNSSLLWNKVLKSQIGNITSQDLKSSAINETFAIVCSLDKNNIGIKSQCILQKIAPGVWDICDETGMITHKRVHDTDDEGPVKEWGLWYQQPINDDIADAQVSKTTLVECISTTATNKASGSKKSDDTEDLINEVIDGYQLLADDAELEEVEAVAMLASINNNVEDECDIEFSKSDREKAAAGASTNDGIIRVPRELGTGTTVTVHDTSVTCNCEIFNRWRICRHCVYFEFLHCGCLPHGSTTDGNISYPRVRERILGHIKDITF